MSTRLLFLIPILLIIALSSNVYAEHSDEEKNLFIMSGVILSKGNKAILDRFVRYVEKESGYPLTPYFVDSYEKLSTTLRLHKDAIAWTCGAPYVKDSIKDAQQLIAVPLFQNKPLYRSLLITQKGRNEKSLLDFSGQVFTYSDEYSNSGLIVPAYRLKKKGIAIDKYFRLLFPAGNHEQSIEAVINSLADVAAVDEYIWVEYLKNHPEARHKISVIEHYGPYPFTPIVAGEKVSLQHIGRLQQALVYMANTDEGKALLKAVGLDGFVLKRPSFYTPIKEMLEFLYGDFNE